MGGLVGVSEVLPDERWLAVSTREPYLPFLIPAEDVNRSATHNDDGIVRATSRHVRVFMLATVVHSYTGGSADPEADTFGYRAAGGPLKSTGGEFW